MTTPTPAATPAPSAPPLLQAAWVRTTRTVNGDAVTVAGGIALQLVFSGAAEGFTQETGRDTARHQVSVQVPDATTSADFARTLGATEGLTGNAQLGGEIIGVKPVDAGRFTDVTVGDCRALREAVRLRSCTDGDVFVGTGGAEVSPGSMSDMTPEAGQRWFVDPGSSRPGAEDAAAVPWAPPGALPAGAGAASTWRTWVRLDPSDPDAIERVRNVVAVTDPLAPSPIVLRGESRSAEFTAIRTGLSVGTVCVLLLVGASLLVTQLEQLRERRKLLSALVAFGTRRRTLTMSVLWQTALPIGLGLVLATGIGLLLGIVLMRLTGLPAAVDWGGVALMNAVGVGVVALVTLLSLPPLLRLLRPDGLRTE